MQQKCDIYLSESTASDRLKFVSLFDGQFQYRSDVAYVGYLGVQIDRVKLVAIVADLRRHGILCFSVPIKYRDDIQLSMDAVWHKVEEYAKSIGAIAVGSQVSSSHAPPVYWGFQLVYDDKYEEKAGGVVMVDRLDGHVWSGSEYEQYMYDYNNIL